jgi:hypothetical protein
MPRPPNYFRFYHQQNIEWGIIITTTIIAIIIRK